MANDLERAVIEAARDIEDRLFSEGHVGAVADCWQCASIHRLKVALESMDAAPVAPPSPSPTRDQYVAAIWEARDDPTHHRPGMTWAHLLECLETNPGQYTSDYE